MRAPPISHVSMNIIEFAGYKIACFIRRARVRQTNQCNMYLTLLLALVHIATGADAPRKIPVLGSWKKSVHSYPLEVFEAAGGVIGDDKHGFHFTVMGGFFKFPGVTSEVYSLRLDGSGDARWTRRASMPVALTHMAQAIEGRHLYGVGGYEGAHPGPSSRHAFEYDIVGDKWTKLPMLPERRAGGGLVVVKKRWLIYSSGVDRPARSMRWHYDKGQTWRLDMWNKWQGWVDEKAPITKARNHMGAVASCGRIFFVGGQKGSNEYSGNMDEVDEYDEGDKVWRNVSRLPVKRGHISASVLAYRCGVLVVGGTGQQLKHLDDVLWWEPGMNMWHTIGRFPKGVSTPVCGIYEDMLICSTGQTWKKEEVFMAKIGSREIS